ncbi:MAG: glucose 1-dehydrogenase [Candidatus Acidiferrales bacterium]|jgi:NAD(P)-dependent dehydrogenase (short-subunit alcohol dehydrogenase family)
MELGLKGKVVLVTGSSKGIGRSIAAAFAREGCQVVINGRHAKELDATAAELRGNAQAAVHAVVADVTEAEGAKRVVDETVAHFGTIHILVNNAGGAGRFGSFADLTDDEWIGAFNLNVLSAVRATRAALPHMQKQRWGRIVNISSESGVQPDAMMPHYNAAKSALNSLTKSLSKAYGKEGILVNTVSPAFIRTPLLEGMFEQQARTRGITVDEVEQVLLREFRPNIVLGRAGKSDETAGIVVFLASEQASFITGSNFRVDGGSVASI